VKDLQSGLRVLFEVVFLAVLGLDGFALFISVFLPLKPGTFQSVILLDLAASLIVLAAYLIRPGVRDRWNAPLVAIPFYFIGVKILGAPQHSPLLAALNLIKVAGIFIAVRDLAGSVGEFMKRSRLGYGVGLFISVIFVFTILFYIVESPVNPLVVTYEDSLWYVLQTITTVGYGDIVPVTSLGRFTGMVIMFSAIASTSLITASATSTLLETLRGEQERIESRRRDEFREIKVRISGLEDRLERIEELLRELRKGP
jgi:voltage-gated potassium channel